jgi:hypothetical protein
MKENNFYSDDFERLIREKTEQYKMYPSEIVWKGVHNSLHTKRRWFIGSMSLLVTGILFLAGRELIAPSHPTVIHKATAAGSMADADVNTSKGSSTTDNISRNLLAMATVRQPNASASRHNNATGAGDEQDPVYSGITITISNPVLTQSDLSGWLSHVVSLPEHAPDLAVVDAKMTGADQVRIAEEGSASRKEADVAVTARINADQVSSRQMADDGVELTASGVLESLSDRSALESRNRDTRPGRIGTKPVGTSSVGFGSSRGTVPADDRMPDSAGASTRASAAAIAEAQDKLSLYWMQVTAMNILEPPAGGRRTYLEMTLTPTVNFRSLSVSGSDPAEVKNLPGTQLFATSPHSPAVGFQVGGSMLYRVTRNLSLKAGLQFNFSRFKIYAYTASGTQQSSVYYTYYGLSTLQNSMRAISNANPAQVSQVFSSQETLNNDYFQLSAPIGFELRVLGNERLQFNVGATIQPSYLINTNSYMLTEDFQNYTKAPQAFRRWNLNGGVEAFLSYRMGDIRWEVGPEFRYQFFSSYSSQYPLNENIKGYGLRIGITKPLP